jgi:hypothetical protein
MKLLQIFCFELTEIEKTKRKKKIAASAFVHSGPSIVHSGPGPTYRGLLNKNNTT